MEKEFDSKLSIQSNSSHGKTSQRSKSFAFRAPQENFTIQDFELGKIYGVGSYSKVVRAKKKDTGIVYALKIMDKNFITKENKTAYVKLERIVLDQLDHPGIIRLYFTFQDTYSLYMALESCEGGELFDQITRKGRLSEDEARFYTAEVVEALEYIHNLGLLHRDIKPENLLLTSDGHIKIADFGSVKPMQDSPITVLPNAASDDKACTFVGTAAYVPPEVLNSSPATVGNDLWALGCTLYQMLSGTSPFKDASEWLIFQKIIARDITFPDYFSDEARDLIDRLLDVDPTKRPGAGPDGYVLLKKHPFFSGLSWDNLRMQTPPKLAPEQKLKKYYKKLIAYAIFQPSMTGTHYDILGVKEDATYEEIRTSYRSSILNHHPDKVPKTAEVSNSINFHEDRFLEIQRAWKILSSPTSRSIYDIELQTLRQDATTSEDVSLEDMTVEEADDVVELLYQCRCGDCFSIDSKELKEMGYLLLRDGDSISLQMLNELHAFPASVVLPCGSCSLKIRVLINSANYVR